jgi:hypothetical protein
MARCGAARATTGRITGSRGDSRGRCCLNGGRGSRADRRGSPCAGIRLLAPLRATDGSRGSRGGASMFDPYVGTGTEWTSAPLDSPFRALGLYLARSVSPTRTATRDLLTLPRDWPLAGTEDSSAAAAPPIGAHALDTHLGPVAASLAGRGPRVMWHYRWSMRATRARPKPGISIAVDSCALAINSCTSESESPAWLLSRSGTCVPISRPREADTDSSRPSEKSVSVTGP